MLRDNRGITLVELLASVAVLMLLLLLAYSLYTFGAMNYVNQSTIVENQESVRYTLKVITKDIRRAEPSSITVIGLNELNIDGIEYRLIDSTLYKGTLELSQNIGEFKVGMVDNKVSVEITSLSATNGKVVSLSSTVYLRE